MYIVLILYINFEKYIIIFYYKDSIKNKKQENKKPRQQTNDKKLPNINLKTQKRMKINDKIIKYLKIWFFI